MLWKMRWAISLNQFCNLHFTNIRDVKRACGVWDAGYALVNQIPHYPPPGRPWQIMHNFEQNRHFQASRIMFAK